MFTYTITAYNKYGRPMAVETQVTDHWQATELCCDMSMVYAYAEVINDNFQTHEGDYGDRPEALGDRVYTF